MFTRKCSKMRTDLKIIMFEEKLKSISTEIDVLIGQINDADKLNKEISYEDIMEQLREIQDFVNS